MRQVIAFQKSKSTERTYIRTYIRKKKATEKNGIDYKNWFQKVYSKIIIECNELPISSSIFDSNLYCFSATQNSY